MATPFFPQIDPYLTTVVQSAADFNCTELKLVVGHPPLWKCNGEYSAIWQDAEVLTEEQVVQLATSFLDNQQLDDLNANNQVQGSHTIEAGTFEAVVMKTSNGTDISFPITAQASNTVEQETPPAVEEEKPKVEVNHEDERDQEFHPFYEDLSHYLKYAVDMDCSDVHFSTGSQPMWRRYGRLEAIYPNSDRLTNEQVKILCNQFLGKREWEDIKNSGDADYAHATDFARFRASVVQQRLGLEIVMRIINAQIRTMDEINLHHRSRGFR